MLNTVEHVRSQDGEYYVSGSRVSLGVVIAAWKRGDTPERIMEQFPALTLANVYGAITYYLDHQPDMDAHFAALAEEFERLRLQEQAAHPEFYASLRQRIDAWRQRHVADSDVRQSPPETSSE